MHNLHFCPQCGNALQPDDLFCGACGFALSQLQTPITPTIHSTEPPISLPESEPDSESIPEHEADLETSLEDEPAQNQAEVHTNATSSMKWLPIVAVLLLVAAVGGFWWKNSLKSPDKNPTTPNSQDVISDIEPDAVKAPHLSEPLIPPATASSSPFDAFVGIWRAYEANDSQEIEVTLGDPNTDLFIENRNGKLILYPRKERANPESVDADCKLDQPKTVSCRIKDGSSSFTLKLELQNMPNEMVISEIPDMPSEMVILKARQLEEAISANPSNNAADISGMPDVPVPLSQSFFPPIQGTLSAKQAIERIKFAPDVKNWLQQMMSKGGKPFIVVDHEEKGAYIVRAYEIVYNGTDSHEATIGWYSVHKQTGVVDFYIP